MRNIAVFCCSLLLTSGALAKELTGTLKKISETKSITIGYLKETAPFSFLDPSGNPVGYSVDLCRRIATAAKNELGLSKLDVKFVEITLQNRFDAVESGKIDIECGISTITLSRMERVDFTLPTFVTGASLLSKADSPIRTTADVAGKTVVVIRETTTEAAFINYLKDNLIDAEVVQVDTETEGLKLLNDNKVDAFALDQVQLIGQIIQSDNPKSYALSQDTYSYEPYSLMLRRNDADFRLIANRSLAQIYRTKQYKTIYTKWFGRVGLKVSTALAAMYQINALPE